MITQKLNKKTFNTKRRCRQIGRMTRKMTEEVTKKASVVTREIYSRLSVSREKIDRL